MKKMFPVGNLVSHKTVCCFFQTNRGVSVYPNFGNIVWLAGRLEEGGGEHPEGIGKHNKNPAVEKNWGKKVFVGEKHPK